MSLNKITLGPNTTVHEVIKKLDESGVGILAVVDNDGKLIGIVTDGDIRRALLRDSLDVNHIVNRNPKTVPSRLGKAEIVRTLRRLHLRHMPMVDENNRLVDIVFLENLAAEPKENTVIIMAGGLGSRLGQLTQDTPKPMLPVHGRPILEHIIENLKFQGFRKFVLCLNYKADVIRDYFGDGSRFDIEVAYTIEEKRLGTAGALSLIDPALLSTPSIVLNADIMTTIDFDEALKFHFQASSQATMCVKPQAYEMPYACIEFDESMNLKALVEKPKINNYINAGMYLLNQEVVSMVPANEYFDMPNLFQKVMASGMCAKVYCFEDYWVDIGRPVDYSKVNTERNLE